MSRVDLPTNLTKLKTVMTNVDAKNTLLGNDSPIKPVITQKGIVLATDIGNLEDAIKLDNEGDVLRLASENLTAKRDKTANPEMKRIAEMSQIVKTFFSPEYTEVGKWGIPITASGKITYPTDAAARVEMMKSIKKAHEDFAAGTSPVQPYITKHGLVLGDMVTALETAQTFENQALSAAEQAENRTAQRNLLADPVVANAHIIANTLMDLNKDNPKELGEWSIPVDDSPRAPVEQQTKINPLDKKTLTNVIIAGRLANVGETAVNVHKGREVAGEVIVVLPGNSIPIQKGYSVLTVVNPSADVVAIVKVTVSA